MPNLLEAHIFQYRFISLSPHKPDIWFALWKDGSMNWSVPDSFAELLKSSAEVYVTNEKNRKQYPWSLAITWGAGRGWL